MNASNELILYNGSHIVVIPSFGCAVYRIWSKSSLRTLINSATTVQNQLSAFLKPSKHRLDEYDRQCRSSFILIITIPFIKEITKVVGAVWSVIQTVLSIYVNSL